MREIELAERPTDRPTAARVSCRHGLARMQFRATTTAAVPPQPVGIEYRIVGLTCGFWVAVRGYAAR